MRKLAGIQRILKIEPIAGADAIEKATVLGWQLVIKKEEFKAGDLCVYIEIDSLLPERPEFEFLRSKNFRIKTVRLRGQISQGICFPLSILPEGYMAEENEDVTEILGIEKYEAPVPESLSGIMKGAFPSFIPRTDETRVQVLQELLDEHKGALCYITEKLDGTSMTCFVKDGEFGVCSRNMELAEQAENTYWRVAKELNIEAGLRSLGKNIAIQGELMGERIQGNKLNLKGQMIYVFSVFLVDEYRYADYKELTQITAQIGLPMVPVLTESYTLDNNISNLLQMANIPSVLNTMVMAEGIVIRLKEHAEHISFKAISNEFLLKYGE